VKPLAPVFQERLIGRVADKRMLELVCLAARDSTLIDESGCHEAA
jgi:hypothetical protein